MDLRYSRLQWLALALFLLHFTVRGVHLEVCETAVPESIFEDGWFEVHTFEVQEGILLQPRKLIGTVTLFGEDSAAYSFDEPYFKKPYNLKTSPRPAHFDVVFLNVSSSGKPATTLTPEYDNSTTRGPTFHQTSTSANNSSTSSGYYASNLPSRNRRELTWNNVTSSLINVTSTTVTSYTAEPEIQCVIAQIYQIYDLDREVSDTHYLTISNSEIDPLWAQFWAPVTAWAPPNWGVWGAADTALPVLVVVKVSDINDNSPVFVKESLESRISRNTRAGSIVAEIKATDADIGVNSDLRYSLPFNTVRRGEETESPDIPNFIISERLGVVALLNSIADLKPQAKVTFSVIVKDKGGSYVSNRATASVTISIVDDTWVPEINPSNKSIQVSGGVIAAIVVGSILLVGVVIFVLFRWRRTRVSQHDAQLEFMLDDENLISA